MPNAKPTTFHAWATGPDAAVAEPLNGEKLLGWVPGDFPPAAYLNFIERTNHRWALYLSTFEQNAFTWPEKQTFTLGADLGDKLTVLAGGIEVTGNSSVAGTFGITGDTTVGGTFGAAGDTTVGGTLSTAGALTVAAGGAAITGNSSVAGTFSASGNTALGGTLGVTGGITAASINVGTGTVAGGPHTGTTGAFSGAVTVGGTLGVTGASAFTAITTTGAATLNSVRTATVTPASTNGPITVEGAHVTIAKVGGLGGTLSVQGQASFDLAVATQVNVNGYISINPVGGYVESGEPIVVGSGLTLPEGGTAPAFENGWGSVGGAGTGTCLFYRDSFRLLHLHVYVVAGNLGPGARIFLLPSAYRPQREQRIVTDTFTTGNTRLAHLVITPGGDVYFTGPGMTSGSLGAGVNILANGTITLRM